MTALRLWTSTPVEPWDLASRSLTSEAARAAPACPAAPFTAEVVDPAGVAAGAVELVSDPTLGGVGVPCAAADVVDDASGLGAGAAMSRSRWFVSAAKDEGAGAAMSRFRWSVSAGGCRRARTISGR